jgi:hypothetical protein
VFSTSNLRKCWKLYQKLQTDVQSLLNTYRTKQQQQQHVHQQVNTGRTASTATGVVLVEDADERLKELKFLNGVEECVSFGMAFFQIVMSVVCNVLTIHRKCFWVPCADDSVDSMYQINSLGPPIILGRSSGYWIPHRQTP